MRRVLGCVFAIALFAIALRDARSLDSPATEGLPAPPMAPDPLIAMPGAPIAPIARSGSESHAPHSSGASPASPRLAPVMPNLNSGSGLMFSGRGDCAGCDDSATRFAWRGSGSCNAQGCHGGVDSVHGTPPGSVGNEHMTWVRFDPHGKAHAVLLTDRSKKIEQLYRSLPEAAMARPELDGECLNCHVAQSITAARVAPEFVFSEGVGCEACHGASDQWIGMHYASWWKGMSADYKASFGMRDTNSLAGRAMICADCHIGKPGSEVNHDLIAAGHPRLRFEFASYHANYPKHWDAGTEKLMNPDLEARAWAIGQLASAKAAIRLLKWRAEAAPKHPWPEFAEYECAACHQDLAGPYSRSSKNALVKRSALPWDSWLPIVGDAKVDRKLTAVPWGTWYLPLLPIAEPQAAAGVAPLAASMTKFNVSAPDAARQASQALGRIDEALRMLEHGRYDSSRIRGLMQSLAGPSQGFDLSRWDQAAQLYLGLGALHNGLADQEPGLGPDLEQAIQALTGQLQIKPGTDAAVGVDPDKTRWGLRNVEMMIGR